ncbi:CAF17-like 4Fe-4S cluster assembly/insertion protein YgfZ [Aquipuribacter sp. MA13-6]|uniref:CAF17-like 4Fe-4S cluster assembly/insertion protein YgfZ n=1 Tax=unclassified Aquipuribacter TaxID=2635084 RepID=UPI003EE8BBA5
MSGTAADAVTSAAGPDAGVAAHYGDPLKEQKLLEEGLAVVDLSHRGVVTVTGPDRLTWLNSLSTQKLDDLTPRRSVEALLLSPHGHVEHDLHVVDDGTTTWLVVEGSTTADLVTYLDRMRFMLRVEVADVTDGWAVLGEPVGRESVDGEPLAWVDPWPRTGPLSVAYGSPDDLHPGLGWAWREVLVPRTDLGAALGDRPLAGTWALEALRVAAGRPRHLHETDHRTIPHELDLLRTAVHLQKGCYRGQETVARVHNLGRPPRRIVLLHLDGSGHTLPAEGDELRNGEKVVGRLTTVVRHHELGPIALAVVKRNTPVDAVLDAGGVAASQDVLVAP